VCLCVCALVSACVCARKKWQQHKPGIAMT